MKTARELNQERLLEFLSTKKCERCGLDDIRALTFDHRNRKTKTATVSTLINKGFGWDRVMKEINKCDILCLSCHTITECERDRSKRQLYWEELNETRSNIKKKR